MKKAILISAIAASLASCTTTEQANEAMASRFSGTSVDNFFLQYGPPVASHELYDGRRMFLWAENPESVHFPGTTTSQVNVVGNTAWVSGWTSPGSTVTVQCQVRIVVDQQGQIEQILSHSDSVGWWQMSRCNEVFG